MSVFRSQVRAGSADFKKNAEHHRRLAGELRDRLESVRQGGGDKARML